MKFRHTVLYVIVSLLFIACNSTNEMDKKAKLSSVGSGDDKITVVVVSGTPYEMGYQLGEVLKDDIKACMTQYLAFAEKGDPERFNDKVLDNAIQERYAGWNSQIGKDIESGKASFETLEQYILDNGEPQLQSGRQELLENILNEYI